MNKLQTEAIDRNTECAPMEPEFRVLPDLGGAAVRGEAIPKEMISEGFKLGEAAAAAHDYQSFLDGVKYADARRAVRGEAVEDKWQWCPECGSDETHYEEGDRKQCAICHQEWFADIDYSDVVRQNLAAFKLRPAAPVSARAADALDSQPTDDGKLLCAMEFEAVELGYAGLAGAMAALRRMKADPDADREALIACLGDDAATLSHINPDDEMAQTMREAAAMLESDEVVIATLGMASSQPTDGGVRNG